MFSIAVSVAAGYGVYHWIKEHPDTFKKSDDEPAATTTTQQEKPTTPKAAVPAPPIDEPEAPTPAEEVDPMVVAMQIAEARAVDPVDIESQESPVFGTPGISGGLERGSVERRFKPRAAILQRCFQRGNGDPATLHVGLQVESDGKVSRVMLSTGEDSFRQCVASALNFTFSATKDGHPAAVVQPIAFR
ncbi:MAG TPA: hypothetical protein VL326_00975 [Kofleriaceae bacterium]|nr:hypothetical protein [Kofleriaceae bacterium]